MNIKLYKTDYIEIIKGFIIGLFVVIGTFPENDWSFSIGVDSPLSWVFNYFFKHGLSMGKHIIFPHGPLAFFMYPLQENILIATLIISILKILLVFNILWMVEQAGITKWFFAFIFAYFVSTISGFNHLILANLILFYVNFFNHENWIFKFAAFILTAFAFYIKSYVAIMSGTICFSFLTYYFFDNKNYKKLLFDVLTIIGLLLVIWFLMYETFAGFITYIVGMFHLAEENSSAASYYPYNNWWILSLFLLIIFSLPFINKTKKSLFYGTIITLSLFAAWKHGMAREDIYHVRGFLIFVIISLFIFVFFQKQKSFRNLTISILAIFLLSLNMNHSVNYFPAKYELFKINNFIEFTTNFSRLKAKSDKEIYNNILGNRLPQNILDSIKSKTVDIYPWDYSIIAANDLNWQPRVVIQSYASYTSWLDNKNAAHFDSKNAPFFLIWELDKITKDVNGSDFNSIDNRYLLNDEPQTMVQILNHYEPFYSDKKFMVFKKRSTSMKSNSSIIACNYTQWGKWNSVPNSSSGLLRLKLTFDKSILQSVKSFFYKDEQVWIYLMLSNEIIHKYRIIPKNAKDGIWIYPYIFNTTNKHADPSVRKIMFICSNRKIMKDNLSITWEKINFNNEPDYVLNFFGKSKKLPNSININLKNTLETVKFNYLNKFSENQIINYNYHLSTKSLKVEANSFSSSFSIPLDSLSFCNLSIVIDCWIKSKNYDYSNNVSLVLSIDDNSRNIWWKGIPIDDQLIDNKQWNNISSFIDYVHEKRGCILKAYIWNSSNKDVYIDDFRVIISNNYKHFL